MTPISNAPVSVTEKDLLTRYAPNLTRMVQKDLEHDMESERLTQVLTGLTNIQYWQGKQYIVPKLDKSNGTITIESAKGKDDSFSTVTNVFAADGSTFIGAVSSRAPNAKALPESEGDDEDEKKASEAQAHLLDLRRKWKVNRKQKDLGYNAWVTGPTFGYTPYVADGHKYGFTEEPVVEVEEVVNEFGESIPTPRVVDMKRYANGDVECHLANILYVTVPYKAKELADAEYLCYEYLENKSVLRSLYKKQLKDEKQDASIDGTGGSRETTFQAQEQAVTPSGQAQDDWRKNKWRYSRWWIRPCLYGLISGGLSTSEDAPLEDEDGEAVSLSDVLLEQFPDGLKLTFVNTKLVAVAHERMDDVWAVCKVGRGDRIIENPIGSDVIPLQRSINNLSNMGDEIVLRTITKVIVDAQLFDREALKDSDAVVHEFIPADLQSINRPIKDMVHPVPTAQMPEGLERWLESKLAIRRDVGGVNEALSGGGTPAPTYRAEKQRRDQALGRFATFYDCTQDFWEAAYTNGIKQRAKYGSGKIKVNGENGDGGLIADMAALAEDGWYIECEEGIPMSFGEETDRALFLINESADPEMPAKMGLFDSVGAPTEKTKQMLGIRGISVRGENERNKVNQIIKRLLAEPPIEDIDPMGMPMPPQPSILPEDYVDDHEMFAQITREWCISKAGLREQERNEPGYKNVVAYLIAQQNKADELKAVLDAPLPGGEPPPEGGEVPAEESPAPAFDTAPPQLG